MHTVQLLLKPSKYERYEIDRRFRALAHLHNVCGGCGRFLGPELSNSKTASILHRTQTP